MSMPKKGLGRGLSALIPSAAESRTEARDSRATLEVAVDRITPSPFQPRRSFDEAKIEELAASIRNQGIIQPLVVRPRGDGFELIAGERRWRAAMKAGLSKVPVVTRDASDHEALQLALVENLQREDLNPIEEASGYRRLQEEFHWSQEEMAEKVGKSRPAIANSLRLLALPIEVQQEISAGNLPAGQARALLGLHTEPLIVSACRDVIAKGLSTRETEKMVRLLIMGRKRRRQMPLIDPDLKSIVEQLQRSLGTRVRLLPKARSAKGKIEIEYYSAADL
ncbi:MAG TPA: ParB/RepB/Spo0J family partition protein, partial [Candidatus Binatia bacterium]|nr:ParB/RepB/Spo0J family partition protein [Candidatus Binatia bacterium]